MRVNAESLAARLAADRARVDARLEALFGERGAVVPRLDAAMRHGVLVGSMLAVYVNKIN